MFVGMIGEDRAGLGGYPDKGHPLSVAEELHRRSLHGDEFRCFTYAR